MYSKFRNRIQFTRNIIIIIICSLLIRKKNYMLTFINDGNLQVIRYNKISIIAFQHY